MKTYSKFEILLAQLLSFSPKFKSHVKRFYLFVCYFLLHKNIKADLVSFSNECESFFGYYDSCPENDDYIIFHESHHDTKKSPCNFDSVFISVFDKKQGCVIKRIETRSFNWQQGSRLFWLGRCKFIYNDFLKGRYVSIVYDIEQQISEIIEYPVQAVSYDKFVSIDYNLLKMTRPDYGYFNLTDDYSFSLDKPAFEIISYDGIVLDVINFSMIINFLGINVKKSYEVNHFTFDNELIVFMFRWYVDGVRNDILLSYDTVNKSFHKLLDNKMVSHYCILPNNQVLVYANDVDLVPKYIVLCSDSGRILASYTSPYGDGHPTYYKQNKVIVDTYPNRNGHQSLIVFDYTTGIFDIILTVNHSPFYYGQSRCDLHPRYSPISNSVYFDTVTNNKRTFARVDLSSD